MFFPLYQILFLNSCTLITLMPGELCAWAISLLANIQSAKKIISASGRLRKLMLILDIFIDIDLPLHKSFYRRV